VDTVTLSSPRSRRTVLGALGTALGGVGLAGCAGDDPTGPAETPTVGTTTRTGTATTPTDSTERSPAGTDTATATDSTAIHAEYDTTEVRVLTPGGTLLGSVTAAIADTRELQYLGLSDTSSLPEDRGMLFVFDEPARRTFVMREMDFGIDIVYADSAGEITRIHHARAPGPDEDGNDQRYPGRGQYVLEVNYDWTTERGVTTGDVLEFDL
jgi:hypothetical protein